MYTLHTDLREGIHDAIVEVDRVQVAVIVQKDLHERLRGVAEGGYDVQHLPLVVEGTILTLQHSKEHGRDEHLDLRLEVRLVYRARCHRQRTHDKNVLRMGDGPPSLATSCPWSWKQANTLRGIATFTAFLRLKEQDSV